MGDLAKEFNFRVQVMSAEEAADFEEAAYSWFHMDRAAHHGLMLKRIAEVAVALS